MAGWCLAQVADEIGRYSNMQKLVWCQEEPKNNGAWTYVKPRIKTATREIMKKVRDSNGWWG